MDAKDVERFWSKVDVQGPDDCWEWTAGCFSNGYGAFKWCGTTTGAHRFSWVLANGPIPGDMYICHRCDNPKCMNPRHLFLCTQAMNVADMMAKGRSARGGANANAKLTEDDVLRIRSIYATGKSTQKEIAAMFGVSDMTIYDIIHNRTWKHLPGVLNIVKMHGSRCPYAKLTEDKVLKIRDLYATGRFSQEKIAIVFGIARQTIGQITRGETWKHLLKD